MKNSESCEVLGISDVKILDFERRYFYKARQVILDYLIDLKKRKEFDLVLVPVPCDLHQDHRVVTEEAVRAFRENAILGYEMPYNNLAFHANCFVRLTQDDVTTKVRALGCYLSQRDRPYFKEDCVIGLARTRGMQIQARFAEAFEIIRMSV